MNRTLGGRSALLLFLVGPLTACHAQETPAAPVTVRVDEGRVIKPFSRRMFGLNYDWTHAERYLINADGAFQPDALALFKGFPLPLNRMSGTDSQELIWKGAIGPVQQRIPMQLYPFFPKQKLRFGLVEWIQWVLREDPRASFTYTINLLKDTPQDAQDLVYFLTGHAESGNPREAHWAGLRQQYGLDAPVPIAAWELGNEMDLKIPDKNYVWTAEQYVEAARATIAAIRQADPAAPIAIHGSSSYKREWNQTVLKGLGAQADYFVLHFYYQGTERASADGLQGEGGFQGHTRAQVRRWIDEAWKDCRQTPGAEKIRLYLSEHARWPSTPKVRDETWKKNWYQTHSLDGCLATASMLSDWMSRPEVAMGAYHCFSGGPWGLCYRDPATKAIYTTGVYELYRMFGKLDGESVVWTEVVEAAGTTPQPSDSGGRLETFAVSGQEGIWLVVVNRGEAVSIVPQFVGSYSVVSGECLTAPSLDAYNTAAAQPVTLAPLALNKAGKVNDSIELARQSVVLLRFRANAAEE